MARYDEHVEWYEEFASTAPFVELREHAVSLLGPPTGRCLDLGCGTGLALPLLEAAGWDALGIEVSEGQLALARTRGANVLQADAHELPFEDGSLAAVVSILTHTDFDDARAVCAEVARGLRPGGVFVYAGVHPVFASPFALRQEDGTTLFIPGIAIRAGTPSRGTRTIPVSDRASASTICRSPPSSTPYSTPA